MLNLVGLIGQFDREIFLERQREGIERAKRERNYKGRQPTAGKRADEVVALYREGVRPTNIARKLGISRASVYHIFDDHADELYRGNGA